MVVFAVIQIDNILSNSKMTSEIYAEILCTSVFLNPTTMTKLHIFWVNPPPGQTDIDSNQFCGKNINIKVDISCIFEEKKSKNKNVDV